MTIIDHKLKGKLKKVDLQVNEISKIEFDESSSRIIYKNGTEAIMNIDKKSLIAYLQNHHGIIML